MDNDAAVEEEIARSICNAHAHTSPDEIVSSQPAWTLYVAQAKEIIESSRKWPAKIKNG